MITIIFLFFFGFYLIYIDRLSSTPESAVRIRSALNHETDRLPGSPRSLLVI